MDQARFNDVLTALRKGGEEYVDCSSLRLEDDKVSILISAMEAVSTPIKTINLSSNCIGDAGAAALSEFLKKTPVNEVYVSENKIGEEGAAALLSLFAGDTHPSILDLRGNSCPEHYIVRIGFLAKSKTLNASIKVALLEKRAQTVSFEGLKYVDLDVRLIRYILLEVEGLESVDFSFTTAGDSGVWAIGQILKDSKIKKLSMRKCALGAMGVGNFIESSGLKEHEYVEELDFSENMNITNEIGKNIPTIVFNTNNKITAWNLNETSLSPEIRHNIEEECELNKQPMALKKTVVALRKNLPETAEINLQWEKGMSQCIRFLWRFIRDSSIIEKLNVSNSGIGDADMELMARALYKNTSLRVLDMANNKITAEGVAKLFGAIQRGTCGIQEVSLANNDLENQATTPIIAAIRALPQLKVMNIDVNPRIDEQYVTEIGGLITINQSPAIMRTLLPALEKNDSSVTEVDLSDKKEVHNDESIRLLCEALQFNTVVTKLNLSNNIVGDIGAVFLAELLTGNHTIKEIILVNNSVGNRGVKKFCEVLRINTTLKVLDLSNNVFSEEGVAEYPEMLRVNHHMSRISMAQTRVPQELAVTIQRACDLNRDAPEVKSIYYRLQDDDDSLTDIDLSEANREWALDDMSIQTLATEIKGRDFIKTLNFSGNKIGAEGCRHLADVLNDSNCQITKIDLSKNPVDDDGFVALSVSFPENKTLVELNLLETEVSDVGCELVIPAIKKNDVIMVISVNDSVTGNGADEMKRQLVIQNGPLALKRVLLALEAKEVMEEIDLHNQKDREFGDVACKLLCAAILKNQNLRTLNLSRNKITMASSPYIAEVIEECPNLTFVDLSKNEIDDRGADQFIGCVERVAHLRTLKVKGNPMSAENQERIAQLLAMNLSSQKLKRVLLMHSRGERLDEAMDFNGKTSNYVMNDDEVMLLAQILRDATEVRALDLGANSITDRGCIALAEVLRANHTMEALYIDQNPVAVAGGEALFYALKINPQLHTLNLEGTQVPAPVLEDITSLLHVNQTPLRERINMRAMPITEVSDEVQFKSTDYHASQQEKLEDEALDGCKRTEQLLLE